MDIIFTALTVLTSITGFRSGLYYQTNQSHFKDCLFEHYGSCSPLATQNSIVDYSNLYALDGTNKYLLIDLADTKTVLYDKSSECIIATYSCNPYLNIETDFKLLNNLNSEYIFAYFDESTNTFANVDNSRFDNNLIHSYYSNRSYTAGNYYTEVDLTSDAVVISNAYYFERLGNRHATNPSTTCCIVAAEILLGYYDTFLNDTIVDEQYDQPTVEYINSTSVSTTSFLQSPGVDTDSNSAFHDYLCDIATNEVGDNPYLGGGMTVYNQRQTIIKYFQHKNLQYTTISSDGNLADLIQNRAKTVIKDTIDSNRPVISDGKSHSTVAYAYNTQFVWVHTGWGFVAATPWSTFESGLFIDNPFCGAIDLEVINNNSHKHSDNYYASNKNKYYCPCGETYSQADIYPIDYGVSTTYYSDEHKTRFYENGVEIRNYYNRVAFVDNNYIVLSARKSGEGYAVMQYWMTKSMRRLEFDLSFYSSSDILSNNNSSIALWIVKRIDNNFYFIYCEDLLEAGISYNRYLPTRFSYHFSDEPIYGFKIEVYAPATGNVDGGRVCIGFASFEHSTSAHNYFGSF